MYYKNRFSVGFATALPPYNHSTSWVPIDMEWLKRYL